MYKNTIRPHLKEYVSHVSRMGNFKLYHFERTDFAISNRAVRQRKAKLYLLQRTDIKKPVNRQRMTQMNRMESTRSPTVQRSASEAELLRHVGSETNLVDMANESNLDNKSDADSVSTSASVQEKGIKLEGGQNQGVPSYDAFCAAAMGSPATKGTQTTGRQEDRKVMSYGAFCSQNPASTKKQRREAMQAFYTANQNFYMPQQ